MYSTIVFKQGDPSFQLLFIMEIRIGCTYLLVVISLYVQFYGLSTMKCQLVLKLWIQNISVSDFYIQKSVRLCVHIGFRKCVYVFSFCLGFSFDYFEEKRETRTSVRPSVRCWSCTIL